MTGIALLIGSDFGELLGVGNDVAAMRGALKPRGFEIRECLGPDATRDGILAAYEQLIEDVSASDAVVVFYSGHGGFVQAPQYDWDKTDLMNMQFIVPTDFDRTTDDDFRGITSVELTRLHARLAAEADNVVVIFDCCHAAGTTREEFFRKTWSEGQSYGRVRAHLDRIHHGRAARWRLGDTDRVVRINACGARQPAVESRPDNGEPMSVLTAALTAALAEAGTQPVSWWAVMNRVQNDPGMFQPWFTQKPEAHGPVHRLLFRTEEEDLQSSLPIVPVGYEGRVRLEGAPLFGVQAGDKFAVMPADADGADDAAKLGDLTVRTVEPLWAEGVIEWAGTAPRVLPIGARAFPTAVTAPELAVRVTGDHPFAAQVRAAVTVTPMLRVMGPGQDWAAEVAVGEDGAMTVSDSLGPLVPPVGAHQAGLVAVVARLRALAVGAALRRLVAAPDTAGTRRDEAFGADVDIEWGIVDSHGKQPMAVGEPLHTRDRFYIQVENRHSEPVFVSVVDIGLSGRVTVQNDKEPLGHEIRPGRSWALGQDELDGSWRGTLATWPEGLPPDRLRPEDVLVFVCSAPQDLRVLEQRPVAVRTGFRMHGHAPLLDLVEQLALGGTRELAPPKAPPPKVRYDVHGLRMGFDPLPRPGRLLAEKLVNPLVRVSPYDRSTPQKLRVQIDELAVHENHTLFGEGPVRVDALVAVVDPAGQPAYQATSLRFETIRDCQTTYPDGLPLFEGQAQGLVDIALWVSRDPAGAADLGELLAGERGTEDGEPGTGLAATDALRRRAAELLQRAADGPSIGLLRHTLLQHEWTTSFSRPVEVRRSIQDFNLVYTVELAE